MTSMFYGVQKFDSDISKWDVSRVKSMRDMFRDASAFNGDISSWDVSSVTKMDRMFVGATSFKQKLCGDAWDNSKATKFEMFSGSQTSGSISETECETASASITQDTGQHVSQALPDRELIVRTPYMISTMAKTMTCPKCGTFKKSGRSSCCAPGGAWFKNCGGAHDENAAHQWLEGVAACKRKSKITGTL